MHRQYLAPLENPRLIRRDEDGQDVPEALRVEKRRVWETILEAVDQGVVIASPDGIVRQINPAAAEILSVSPVDAIGRDFEAICPLIDEAFGGPLESPVASAVRASGVYARPGRVAAVQRGETCRTVTVSAVPVRNEQGRVARVVVLMRDMTCQLDAEAMLSRQAEDLRRRTEDLLRSNEELQDFAAVLSHDLRGPLQTLGGSLELLEQESAQALDGHARTLLGYMRCSVGRMRELISSMLAYSRIGCQRLEMTRCGLSALLVRVLRDRDYTLTAAGASVSSGPLPVVMGDETQLRQLLQNLLENSIKYRRGDPPRITVRSEEREEDWRISVADNGIGIEPRHFGRIFQLFQRAHPGRADAGGLGVGLATCKRIIERHGGRIWVESEPGRGSTFHFTLPKQLRRHVGIGSPPLGRAAMP